MFEVRSTTAAAPAAVWSVVADGWLYPTWVVGASRMRGVDDAWPAEGARLHHSFGAWPALIDDVTEVLVSEPPNRVVMQARGWPMGEATVELTIDAWGSGSMITIVEDATKGPGTLVPGPVRQPLIAVRNRESLRRLISIAEGRGGG